LYSQTSLPWRFTSSARFWAMVVTSVLPSGRRTAEMGWSTATSVAARQAVTIKLATFAPANSAWHKALLDMGTSWTKVTAGRVTLRVYPGGTPGTEASTVKMMSPAVGELQAALLLPPGVQRRSDIRRFYAVEWRHASPRTGPRYDERIGGMRLGILHSDTDP